MDTAPGNLDSWIQIADGIYWTGQRFNNTIIECNPYLVIEGDEAVLIDPGSVLDFGTVLRKVTSLIPLDRISLIVADHEDPDLCGSIPEFAKAGLAAPVAVHWRTATLIAYYGITNPLYIVNEEGWEWRFATGRRLRFIPAPYCHFAGAIMTWDEKTQTLFSGDLFGAITSSPGLIADESYREPMKAFHEHYIPSHEVLMPVMDSLLALDIRLIAPQHGKVITEDIRRCILELRSLKCGAYLSMNGQPLSREPETNQLPLERILNLLVDRLAGLFGSETVRKTFVRTPFRLRDDVLQFESLPGTGSTTAGTAASGGPETDDIISLFIEQIVLANSLRWYSLIEPYLFGLLAEYRIPLPRWVLDTAIITAPAGEEPVNNEERVLHDRKTGLYNGIVYRQYLDSIRKRKSTAPYGILCFSVDNLEEINQLYGRRAGDEALKALVYLLKNAVNNDPAWIFFKLEMPYIACIADNVPPGRIREMAEQVRYAASEAEFTPEKLVISAGILYVDQGNGQPGEEETEHIDRILLARLFRARKSPSGGICDYLRETDMNLFLRRKILLVEPDESYIRFLEPYFTAHGYHLMAVSDGTEALKLRDDETPDLIIAEAMAPRMNGFELRERMLTSSYGRQIPFILVSRRKDEEFIRRAAAAGILLFLKKPFSKTELLGLVDNLLRQDS